MKHTLTLIALLVSSLVQAHDAFQNLETVRYFNKSGRADCHRDLPGIQLLSSDEVLISSKCLGQYPARLETRFATRGDAKTFELEPISFWKGSGIAECEEFQKTVQKLSSDGVLVASECRGRFPATLRTRIAITSPD